MRIFIAGAAGAVGMTLIQALLKKNHEIIGVTQSRSRAELLFELGVTPSIVDISDATAIRAAMMSAKPDLVIDLFTSLPKTYTHAGMRAMSRLDARVRREGSANLLAAANAARVKRFILQSAAFWYAPGDGLANENDPFAIQASPGIAAGAKVYKEMEESVLNTKNLEAVVLRLGVLYGPGTWFDNDGNFTALVKMRKAPIVEKGEGVWSFVHVEDAAFSICQAISCPPGIYNICDDKPLKVSEWLPKFAEWIEAPAPEHVLAEEAIRLFGEDFVYYATKVRGASNAKAKEVLNLIPHILPWSQQENRTR